MFSHTNHPRIVLIQPRFKKKKNMKNTLKEVMPKLWISQALIQEVMPKPPQLEPGGASALPKPSRSSKEVLPIHTYP